MQVEEGIDDDGLDVWMDGCPNTAPAVGFDGHEAVDGLSLGHHSH